MSIALETTNLGKRYGFSRRWALRECALSLPAGRVAALVGPNGAGKTTLLQLAVGLLQPTEGKVRVFGHSPFEQQREVLPRVGFVAQGHPLYKGFSVADLLTMGRKLNPNWNQQVAVERLKAIDIPLNWRVGRLSGGQQAQVALALALAKQPDLMLLDEPLASLDPLARRNLLSVLMGATAERGLTVLLSSHIITDLERVCDYLILLSASHVQLAGDIDEIVRSHKWLLGPRTDTSAIASIHNIIQESHTNRQTRLLVRINEHLFNASWEVHDATLEDIVLAYMGQTMSYNAPVEPPTLQRVRKETAL